PQQVHQQAERIEHILTQAQELQLQEELANSQSDPHGKLIPNSNSTIPGESR
ncbi:MAG: iron dependent repressor, metal binding and dimerization domain protein, partial [Pseudomonadota bacterium]